VAGVSDVFVMPAGGGEAKRMTFEAYGEFLRQAAHHARWPAR
jgi:hypothetical protein